MVSTGVKSNELPIRHLAKTFYFVLSFHFKAKLKDLTDSEGILEFWIKH